MADPLFDKVWTENSAASIRSANFNPSIETRLYESRPNGYKLTVSGTNNSQPYQWEYEAYYDGQAHPVSGRTDVDAITIYKLDSNKTCGFFTKNLLPGGPYARSLSDDGKTLTVEAAGRNQDGSPFYDVIEYKL